MADSEKLKQKIAETIADHLKNRKKVEGRVNITGVEHPKKKKPKHLKEHKTKPPAPANVGVGAHGGRYIQEPSGHKKYITGGGSAGARSYKKSIVDVLEDIIKKGREEFIKSFKGRK